MNRNLIRGALALLAVVPVAHAADAEAGKKAFTQCAACHTMQPGGLGPSLAGIVGRKSAAVEGFAYSPAMKRANLTWDEKTLEAFLAAPQKVVPGNKMPYAGEANADVRESLVLFLKSQ